MPCPSDLRPPRDHDAAEGRWQRVEVRHLEALVAVAQEQSFRRAADRLGYVQSAISGQIAHLERVVGTRLLERSSGMSAVTLTGAGQVLLEHANELIVRLDAAYASVASLEQGPGAAVRIAGTEHFAPGRLARILRLFRQRHPAARVALADPRPSELSFELLASGALDLIACRLPLADGPFRHVALERDAHVLLVRADSPFASRDRPPSIKELAGLQLMVPRSDKNSHALDSALRELGIGRRSSLSPHSPRMAQVLVGAGLGEAIVPRRLVEPADPGTVAIELPGLLPEDTVVLAFSAERNYPGSVHAFIRAARVACGALVQKSLRHDRAGFLSRGPRSTACA